MRKTTLWTAALWIGAILVAAVSARAEQSVSETRSVTANATISIENVAGSLTIIGSDTNEVVVTGTMGDDVEELEISSDDGELYIEVVIPDDDDWKRERKIAADLEVHVPQGATLDIEAVSASIEISGVNGPIEAASVSGSVAVAGGSSDIEVESVSGGVTVTGGSGSIAAESVSGQVVLNGVAGDLEAQTVSGEIRIDAGTVDDVDIESVAGGVYFKGQLGNGSLDVESHSGNVEILLPADVSAEFEMESFSGRIESDFGPPARHSDGYEPGSSTEFRIGMGEAEVSVQTFSGNIMVQKY